MVTVSDLQLLSHHGTVGDLQLLGHHGYCGRIAVIESPWLLWATCSY